MSRLSALFVSLATMTLVQADDSPLLARLMADLPGSLSEVARKPEHEVQVLYVQIDEVKGRPRFTQHTWRLDDSRYFYPASTVKLPVALLALEKLASQQVEGLDRDSLMLVDPGQDQPSSIAQDVEKIFLVSDNPAYNRLFDFVGLQGIHDRLGATGLASTHLVHRLSVARTHGDGQRSPAVHFLDPQGRLLHAQGETSTPQTHYHGKVIDKGRGYLQGGKLIEEPKAFTYNNAFPLHDQHRFLRDFFFPQAHRPKLALSEEDRLFAQALMGQYPREATHLGKDLRSKPDTYVKNFIAWEETPIRDSLRCYNKSGQAYGYMIDNAYIVDRDREVAFFLAAVIHVNANQIFNDDVYEYETIGEPFMQALGRAIYRHEVERAARPKA